MKAEPIMNEFSCELLLNENLCSHICERIFQPREREGFLISREIEREK